MIEAEFVSLRMSCPGVGAIVLARPPSNTLTRQVYRELAHAAQMAQARDDIKTVILYGGHEIFCAGDDLTELAELSGDEMQRCAGDRQDAIAAVAQLTKPTVAAVTGYALGSGMELALAADWRIAGDNVKLGAPQILTAMIPTGAARLARTIGRSRAKEMVFSGRFVGATEALSMGLLDQLVAPDDVYDEALRWAQRFVDGPALALAAAKRAIDEGLDGPMDPDSERALFCRVFATQDRVAGVTAQLQVGPGTGRFKGA